MKLPHLILAAVLLPAALGAMAQEAAPRPPVQAFFDNPQFRDAAISPNGKYVAVIVGGKGRRDGISVIDVATGEAKGVGSFGDTDVRQVQWVNDERLLFDTNDNQLNEAEAMFGPGLFAVNRDGSAYSQLARRSSGFRYSEEGLPWHTFMSHIAGPKNSAFAYVTNAPFYNSGPGTPTLYKLNTLNGDYYKVEKLANAKGWLLDASGEVRLAYTATDNGVKVFTRKNSQEAWQELGTFGDPEVGPDSFVPLAFAGADTVFVAVGTKTGHINVHHMSFSDGTVSKEPLLALGKYDFSGKLIMRDGRLIGIHFQRDADGTHWFNSRFKAIQQDIDNKLPNTVNLLDVPSSASANTVLVRAFSDTRPLRYLIYNTSNKTLALLGESYPAIDPARMGTQQEVQYAARDGMDIPAMLTLPAHNAGQPRPMVVLVHGGPYVRGTRWGWSPEVQFLASRGYVVLQPEFRGSKGYGFAHFKAGWKQWGQKMQDDIADGAKWAIEKGYADPARICIAGASYGGYATLMGLANDPGIFRCGVSWSGVTDMSLLYEDHWRYWSDLSDDWREYGLPRLVGDPKKDAAQLLATSPVQQASRITRPLLLAHGAWDRRVPMIHGLRFRDASRKFNPDLQWIEYPNEGHGWSLPATRFDFWTRVEKFLDKHIGKGAGTP